MLHSAQKRCRHHRHLPYPVPVKRGFSLPELMLVLAVGAILMAIGIPQLARAWDRVAVEDAATHLMAAHQRARMMAILQGQVLTLLVDSAALSITSGTRTLWTEPGPVSSGVSLEGPTRRVTFAPEGFTLGLSNASLHLVRGAATRTVVFSRLGRVRVQR
jgi:prepilin-type N-terminal cleavage/methylation domain-containing protein